MTDQLEVEASGETGTPVEVVWRMVSDADRYATWGPWDASGYTSPGTDEPHGDGAVRWKTFGRTRTVERILECEPGHRLAYTVVRGIPVRNYRADVTLEPTGRGTRVRWRATWDRTLLGRIVHRRLATFYPEMLGQLVAAADRQVSDRGPGR